MILLLVCSMEGGELFDRIQKKGHFTERGTLERGEGGRGGEEGGRGIIFDFYTELSCVHHYYVTW